jgi:hypothetical protein
MAIRFCFRGPCNDCFNVYNYNIITADGAQLKRQDDGERSNNNIDGSDVDYNTALQRNDFGQPLLKEIDDNKIAEMMYKLKGFLKQAEGEQYDDGDDGDENEEDDESSELQPTNVKLLDDNLEEAMAQSSYYAQKYDKKVIYIESYRRRGRWLDASYHKGWAYFSSIPEENIVDKLGVKWLVKNVGGGDVVLRNMKYRHHYLDAHHSHWCKVTYSSYPDNKNWARFKIEKRNGRFFFRSIRYPNLRLDEYESWSSNYYAALAKGTGIYAQFRIYIPPKRDYFKLVDTLDNRKGQSAREFVYEEEIGISITNGREISTTVSAEIGGEIMEAFSAGLSFSTTWKTFQYTTYSKTTRRTYKTSVPPGKIMYVRQLVGEYGHYLVRAQHFKFEDVDLQANTQRVVYASGMGEYNRGEFLPNPEGFGGE